MSNPREELDTLAERVERGSSEGSLDSERAVQLRAVEPLLELLGWDVRGPAVVPEASLEGEPIEYLLTINDAPLVAVRTTSPGGDLDEAVIPGLESVMAPAGPSRGLATNGQLVVLVVADAGEIYRHTFEFGALPEHATALEQVHRSVLEDEMAERHPGQREAYRRLATERETVVDAVTDEIVSVTGPEVRDIVSEESALAVDSIIDALGDDKELGPETEMGTEAETTTEPGEDPDTPDDEELPKRSGSVDSPESRDTVDIDHESGDGEYVARFFGGSSSVGAVGTATPRGTTVGVVRYLLENQDLLSAVSLPWSAEDGTAIVDERRQSSEWIALEDASGDAVSVCQIDDPSTARTAIEQLAEAVGLRVMFQGDW